MRTRHGLNALTNYLPQMRETVGDCIARICEDTETANIIEKIAVKTKQRPKRWKGSRKRGLTVDAPRNVLVLRILEMMELHRDDWVLMVERSNAPASEKSALKSSLHPRIRAIIDLPPLTPDVAPAYHKVGWAVLKDATGLRGTRDLPAHPAFQRGGEFYGLVSATKPIAGALSEAWRSVARVVKENSLKWQSRE